MTEETHQAAVAGPRGIVMSIVVSLVAGWVLLIGITFAIQHYEPERTGPHRRAARADLHRRGGRHRRQAAAADRDRRPAVLRHGVGHGELADDLRVLARRRAAGLGLLAPDQPADPDADQRHLARCRRRVPARPALPVERTAYAAVTSIAVIGLYIAYVMPTFLRLRRGRRFPARPVAPGPVEQARGLGSP